MVQFLWAVKMIVVIAAISRIYRSRRQNPVIHIVYQSDNNYELTAMRDDPQNGGIRSTAMSQLLRRVPAAIWRFCSKGASRAEREKGKNGNHYG